MLPWLAKPLQLVLTASVLPAFARHSRVLDAWTARHRATARTEFERTPTLRNSTRYVPLPLRIGSPVDAVLERPEPENFARLFSRPRLVVQITGPGGAGKTSLAAQLGRWLFDEENDPLLLGHPVIVLLLDEDTVDLRASIKARLRSWLQLDNDLPDRLLDELLKKQRLMILFDRLSERKPEVIAAVEKVYSRLSLNALLVTSRRPLFVEGAQDLSLRPEPLNSGNLLSFITSLLQEHEDSGGFGSLSDQLRLGERFIPLLTTAGAVRNLPITPLLVRLFVDRAIDEVSKRGSLDNRKRPAKSP